MWIEKPDSRGPLHGMQMETVDGQCVKKFSSVSAQAFA
jgi:hypothetical protein